MLKEIKPVIKKLDNFLSGNFLNRRYFATIYGSYVYEKQKETSDLDILICAEKVNKQDITNCVSYVKDIHHNYHMSLDTEIKHEKKVLINYGFLTRAVNGEGYLDKTVGKYVIPEIIKTPEYLNSDPLLLRFFLDVLMHKHFFVSGLQNDCQMFQRIGRENLLKILMIVKQIQQIKLKKLIDEFIYHDKNTGDYYLGFENKLYFRTHLEKVLGELLGILEKENKILKLKEKYVFQEKWLKGIK